MSKHVTEQNEMRLQFLGSGDAFGSGGRFNMCMLVDTGEEKFLIDCGASSLIAMKRFRVNPADIGAILITHLHGDHFGGIPFFILDAQFSKRATPLTIVGPRGLEQRLSQLMEAFFPGSSRIRQRFVIEIETWQPGAPHDLDTFSVIPFEVAHDTAAPSFALRVVAEGKTITYSGDCEWSSEVAEAARSADVFVCEAYSYEKPIPLHLDLKTLEMHVPEIGAKHLILTHMSPDMLERIDSIPYETADDGKIIEF
jgi:ribonuclease BN (tRNA processing enzyme)